MSATDRFGEHLAASHPNAALRFKDLLDWAIPQADAAIDAAGIDAVVAAALLLYDKYIAPADIPWVPTFVEATVIDPAAKLLLEQVIRGFHTAVHRD